MLAVSPSLRRDRHKRKPRLGPRRPASPKDSTESEPQGPLQARGVPGIARYQTAIARFDHESSRFVMPRHDFCGFGQPFSRWGGPPEKKYHLRSCSDRRTRAMSGFSRGRSHGKPGFFRRPFFFKQHFARRPRKENTHCVL